MDSCEPVQSECTCFLFTFGSAPEKKTSQKCDCFNVTYLVLWHKHVEKLHQNHRSHVKNFLCFFGKYFSWAKKSTQKTTKFPFLFGDFAKHGLLRLKIFFTKSTKTTLNLMRIRNKLGAAQVHLPIIPAFPLQPFFLTPRRQHTPSPQNLQGPLLVPHLLEQSAPEFNTG